MTDEELIARLRDLGFNLTDAAADRIEALTAKLATCEKYRDAYAECDRIGTQAVRDLEAKLAIMMTERDEAWKCAAHAEKMWGEAEVKLAKSVEVIEWALISWDDHNKHGYNMQGDWVFDARATLAELKGESHD